MYRRADGFTLVELLVVIAIIGVLVALLLPAVQAAREAARRSQCINNVKQIGIAMQNYHDAKGHLPGGAVSCCYGTWANFLLPYLEQGSFANTFKTGTTYTADVNLQFMKSRVDLYTCPSDIPNAALQGTISSGAVEMPNHNYAANYGNTVYGQQTFSGVDFLGAPFGNIDNAIDSATGQKTGLDRQKARPYLGEIPFKQIPDGLSNTLLVSELVQGQGNDVRGRILGFSDGGAFTAWNTPNAALPDVMPGGLCNPLPGSELNPPCVVQNATTTLNPRYLTSRSRHSGGVNSLLADGSCRFVSDDIELQVWRALSTTAGDEVARTN